MIGLEPSSVTLSLRAWSPDAATARSAEFDLFEEALAAFRANGIEIPFPTMNVHLGSPAVGMAAGGVAG